MTLFYLSSICGEILIEITPGKLTRNLNDWRSQTVRVLRRTVADSAKKAGPNDVASGKVPPHHNCEGAIVHLERQLSDFAVSLP